MEIIFLWNSTRINPRSSYFQYLFLWLILFPRKRCNSQLCWWYLKEIEHFAEVLFKWFNFNYMKINSGERHILFSRNNNASANIDDNTVISENKNELLGIILDSKFSFEDHINNPWKKASQKLNALVRIAPYMCLEKGKTVRKA